MNETDSDADIRIAHERRRAAIDAIYSRGSFEMSEYHSPKEIDVMDTADNLIVKSAAFSASGAFQGPTSASNFAY
jgi:hypothetical protein